MDVVRTTRATLLTTVETLVDQPSAITHQPSGRSPLPNPPPRPQDPPPGPPPQAGEGSAGGVRRWGGSPSRHGQLRELPHLLLEPDLANRYPRLSGLKGAVANPSDDELFAADVGLVGVSAAIAETGSLVRASGADRPRSIALVPPTLIAVVEASRIVADLFDWLAGLDPLAMAADAVVITGPSRTADIGMKLVTGVHGPGAVHIVLLDDR